MLDCHPVFWALMGLQLHVALIHKLRWSMMSLSFSLHFINGCFHNQALVDVRSTGAGIKCLYSMYNLSKYVYDKKEG